ncbi:MAG: hypothetical protein NDJ19_08620 [Ramlibacter sp.]|nr:hypothetical protein [Ramlibacter sp.]
MSWFRNNIVSTISALFSSGLGSASPESQAEVGIEEIRAAMLALIGNVDDRKFMHVVRRIRYATDVLSLWYLRGDLMAALASRYGEAEARESLKPITAMFTNMLPQGLKSRVSPLAAAARHAPRQDGHVHR